MLDFVDFFSESLGRSGVMPLVSWYLAGMGAGFAAESWGEGSRDDGPCRALEPWYSIDGGRR